MTAVLQAEKLSKWYGNILGISDINLEIGSGITGLLGPNGAGKSTFLRIAAGQLKPKIGKLTIFGEEVFGNHLLFKRIGFCPEHDSAYIGNERLAIHPAAGPAARLRPENRGAETSEKALATVGLLESKDRRDQRLQFRHAPAPAPGFQHPP